MYLDPRVDLLSQWHTGLSHSYPLIPRRRQETSRSTLAAIARRTNRAIACHPDRSGGISLLFDFLRSSQNRPGALGH